MGIELGLSMNPPALDIFRGPKSKTGNKPLFYMLSSVHVNILDRDLASYMTQNFQTRMPNYRHMAQGIPLDSENLRTSIYPHPPPANHAPYLIFIYSHYEAVAPMTASPGLASFDRSEPTLPPTNSYSSPEGMTPINETNLKQMIIETLTESEVPQEAKEKLFARMKRLHQVPTKATIEDAEFWEVEEGDFGFKSAVKVGDKYYYGEI